MQASSDRCMMYCEHTVGLLCTQSIDSTPVIPPTSVVRATSWLGRRRAKRTHRRRKTDGRRAFSKGQRSAAGPAQDSCLHWVNACNSDWLASYACCSIIIARCPLTVRRAPLFLWWCCLAGTDPRFFDLDNLWRKKAVRANCRLLTQTSSLPMAETIFCDSCVQFPSTFCEYEYPRLTFLLCFGRIRFAKPRPRSSPF